MKKNILLILSIVIVLAAVGISGCLNNDDAANNTTSDNNSSGSNSSDDSSANSSDTSSSENSSDIPADVPQKPVPPFDANLTLVSPIPAGFTFLSTTTVMSHGQHISMTDALFGYQGIYHYGENNTPVLLSFYNTNGVEKTPGQYLQMMKDSHAAQYGAGSQISTIRFNGHEAVLFSVTSGESTQYGQYFIAWSLSDMIVTVTGNVDSPVLETLATSTGY